MTKKFSTALMLTVLLFFSGVSNSEAALRTRLSLTVSHNPPPEEGLSREVSADFIDERGIFRGSAERTRRYTDIKGRSVTETETEFRNVKGELLMSADVAVTSLSDDFTVKSGEVFSQTFSVDVIAEVFAEGYGEYEYVLGIESLPEWLEADGELISSDRAETGINRYHHEFVVYGTPDTLSREVIKFNAEVYISGDVPVMMISASKDIVISAEIVPSVSPDVSPDEVPKSPDVVPNQPKTLIDTGEEDSGGGGAKPLSEVLRDMTPEQKAAVKTLIVNTNVSNLSGLNELVNLETLDLREAVMLESVDLRGNSSVKSVDVKNNLALTSLNISGSRVEHLDTSGCENLAEVNVSGCEELRTLDVSNTPITSLNADGCRRLEVLDCSSCRIEELSLEGCNSLSVLDCSYNSLYRLDAYTLLRLNELRCEHQEIRGWIIGRVLNLMERFGGVAASDGETEDTGVENVVNLKAWDSSGNEIASEYDNETGIAAFSSPPEKVTYDYITGFENVRMDVAIFTGADEDEWPYGVINPPGYGGGCKAVSVIPLFLSVTIALILARKLKLE